MQVVLTTKDIEEACREWLERHYGIKATQTPTFHGQLQQGHNHIVPWNVCPCSFRTPQSPVEAPTGSRASGTPLP